MRALLVAALLIAATPAQAQLYSGWVQLIDDGNNDQQGGPPLRDARTDIAGVDLLERPDAVQLRMRTGGGFAFMGAATQSLASGHEATVQFTLMAPFADPVLQHDIRLVVTMTGAQWYSDGVSQGLPLEYDEEDMPWNFDVALPKSLLMPEDKLRPRDHLMYAVAWLNATTSSGPSVDRAPNSGTADTVELAGGLVLPAWENQRGKDHVTGVDVAGGRNAMHVSFLITDPAGGEPGLYHRIVGSNTDTWIGPIVVNEPGSHPREGHTAIAVDESGALHMLYPTQLGQGGSYRYFSLQDGKWEPEELSKLKTQSLTLSTGPADRADLAVRGGRVVAAVPAEGGLHVIERMDGAWVELTALAGATWPALAIDGDGDVYVTFHDGQANGGITLVQESTGWSRLPIQAAVQAPPRDEQDQALRPAFDFSLRPDGAPVWIWRTPSGDGPGGGGGGEWIYMVLDDGVVREEEVPFQRNAHRVDLAFDHYGNAHIGIGSTVPANYLLRTIWGHWYLGPDAQLEVASIGVAPDGAAAVLGMQANPASPLSVNFWPTSPIYDGFAPRYDPLSGLGLGEEGNSTVNVTEKSGAKKESPVPAWVPAVVATLAVWRRRN